MTVKQLIARLQKNDPKSKVIVFAEGKLYPVLVVKRFDKQSVELGCGWAPIDDEEEES